MGCGLTRLVILQAGGAERDRKIAFDRIVFDPFNQQRHQAASFADGEMLPKRRQVLHRSQNGYAVGRGRFDCQQLIADSFEPLAIASVLVR